MKVVDTIARVLFANGVRFAFGIPGNDVLETIRACEEVGIKFVLAKSEPAAAFMADAVYQTTGAPAVLIPALGPGLVNALSGMSGALMERSAMIVLGGEMAAPQQGLYTHQVFDHVAAATPFVKWSTTLNPRRAGQQVAKAIDIALAAPAGPVFVNIPADAGRAAATETVAPVVRRAMATALDGDGAAGIGARLARARRPLALIGLGALRGDAAASVAAFAEAWQMPCLTTFKAKGVVDEHGGLALGALGLSPVVDAVTLGLIGEADLLVLIGFDPIELRDAWLDAWSTTRDVVTIDWHAQTHRVFPTGIEVVGDLPCVLDQLSVAASPQAHWPADRLEAYRHAVADIIRPRHPVQGISPATLLKIVSDMLTPDWLLSVDVGAHRILASHAVRCRTPGQMLQSNGLCCMGYALPAAIGAQLAHPERCVVAIVGDGCLLMTIGELAVAVEQRLPIVVIALNDGALSLIKLKQSKMQLAPRAVDFAAPRFDAIAIGLGADGVRVETAEDFAQAFRQAIATRRTVVIDAVINPDEYAEQM